MKQRTRQVMVAGLAWLIGGGSLLRGEATDAKPETTPTPTPAPLAAPDLQGRRIGILLADGFHGGETSQPIAYLRERGATVIPVGIALGTVRSGRLEYEIERTVADLALVDDLAALVIPGGSSPATLRQQPEVLAFVRRFAATGKLVAAICHGPQVLISAGLLDGRQATCVVVEENQYFAVRDELLKAGATYLDQPVVVDGNLLTSRLPDDLPLFNAAIAAALQPPPTARPAGPAEPERPAPEPVKPLLAPADQQPPTAGEVEPE